MASVRDNRSNPRVACVSSGKLPPCKSWVPTNFIAININAENITAEDLSVTNIISENIITENITAENIEVDNITVNEELTATTIVVETLTSTVKIFAEDVCINGDLDVGPGSINADTINAVTINTDDLTTDNLTTTNLSTTNLNVFGGMEGDILVSDAFGNAIWTTIPAPTQEFFFGARVSNQTGVGNGSRVLYDSGILSNIITYNDGVVTLTTAGLYKVAFGMAANDDFLFGISLNGGAGFSYHTIGSDDGDDYVSAEFIVEVPVALTTLRIIKRNGGSVTITATKTGAVASHLVVYRLADIP